MAALAINLLLPFTFSFLPPRRINTLSSFFTLNVVFFLVAVILFLPPLNYFFFPSYSAFSFSLLCTAQ